MSQNAVTPGSRQLGQYLLLAKLGQGGMGTVYKAMHSRLKRPVAIKLLSAARLNNDEAVARFHREMEAIGRLDHPNIVRATDAGEADGEHFLVMDFVEGVDLNKLVHFRGPLPVAEACELARQAALGLQYIHDHALVHRDVKPSNLLLTPQGQVKVLDLGLARLRGDSLLNGELTGSGQVVGTPDYMAPEQALNSRDVDIRADIYSLGCTLYKLLAGKPPFGGPECDSFGKKLLAHAQTPAPPLTTFRSDVPAGLTGVLACMLAKAPSDRFGVPAQVADALAPFTSGSDLSALTTAVIRPAEPNEPGHDSYHGGYPASDLHERATRPETGALTPPIAEARTRKSYRKVGLLSTAVLVLIGLGIGALVTFTGQPHAVVPQDPTPIPGRWYNLLDKPPQELDWPKSALRPMFDPNLKELLVNFEGIGLVKFGTTPNAGYKFQVLIGQHQWTGGVGVFFGYHDSEYEGRPCVKYQRIKVVRNAAGDPQRPFMLYRERDMIRTLADGRRQRAPLTVATQSVPRPNSGEQVLEIYVLPGQGCLQAVRWGGELLPDLVTQQANSGLAEGDYGGALGALCANGTGVFREARLLLLETEDH
jgi:eukaryotic-like serine/threonine-protein kinase